jgi:hypothetical protein
MTIEIRELVIEARITSGSRQGQVGSGEDGMSGALRPVRVPGDTTLSTASESWLIERVAARVRELLRQDKERV